MNGSHRIAGALSLALLLALCAYPSASGSAQARRAQAISVALGELGSLSGDEGQRDALRDALSAELGRMRELQVEPAARARFVLRGSIVRLDREQAGEGERVRCEVSLIVAERRGGAVRMMLTGRAAAEGGPNRGDLEGAVLQAAVRGALRPLRTPPSALR